MCGAEIYFDRPFQLIQFAHRVIRRNRKSQIVSHMPL